jgi:hypothetical protein
LRESLAAEGYNAPGIERIAIARGKREIRYFRGDDEAKAKALGQRLTALLGEPKPLVQEITLPNLLPPRPALEIWVDLSGEN